VLVRPYREVLAHPGALAFCSAGFLARLPISTYGLGFVLLIAATTGRYGLAGAVAGAYGVATAVFGPLLSQAADRYGQARVLVPAAAANSAAVVALVLSADADAPTVVLLACATLVGATSVSVGSLVRARWRHVLAGGGRLHTAFALESVVDELIFIVGPVAITLVATRIDPAAGPLAVAVTALVGAWWLASQRRTEPPTDRSAHTAGGSALRVSGVRVTALVFLGVGGIFGSAEVVTVAFTDERGVPAAAGRAARSPWRSAA
jgi:MFS family permease